MYYVDSQFLDTPFWKGRDFYYPELVKFWVDEGILQKEDIHYFMRASDTISVDKYRKLIRDIFTIFKDDLSMAKTLINRFVGLLRKQLIKSSSCYSTSDPEDRWNQKLKNDHIAYAKNQNFNRSFELKNKKSLVMNSCAKNPDQPKKSTHHRTKNGKGQKLHPS